MTTSYVTGSAIFCNRRDFQQFLSYRLNRNISDAAAAAEALREICCIESRRELATNLAARQKYSGLIFEFNQQRYQRRR